MSLSYLSTLVSLPNPDYQADIEVLKYLNIHRLESITSRINAGACVET